MTRVFFFPRREIGFPGATLSSRRKQGRTITCNSRMASERSKGQPQGKEYAYKSVANIFSLPPPIKFLFNKVPLVIYPPNSIPARAVQPSKKARLYVFSTSEDAAAGRPSFNPTCLKWQVRSLPILQTARWTKKADGIGTDLPQDCPYFL